MMKNRFGRVFAGLDAAGGCNAVELLRSCGDTIPEIVSGESMD